MTPKQIEFAHTIHAAGADLLALINDILDLAKIESGTVTLNIATERFSELSEFVERTFRQVAQDKGLAFTVTLDEGLPPAMVTDGKRVQQILKNLLSNAIKFTPKGEVALHIAPAAAGWSPQHEVLNGAGPVIAMTVTDTGIGIAPSKQRIIFEAFQQADGTTSREYGGTGLGLSISRELARLLGGEVKVESAPGNGSRFTLFLPVSYRAFTGQLSPTVAAEQVERRRLPRPAARVTAVREPEAAPVSQASAQQAAALLAGRKALLVDDDIRNVFALTSALEQYGIHTVHAENGRDGIEALKRHKDVDFVLMDLMMPGMDGYDTIRFIRRMEDFVRLPIIAVTAKAMMGDREKALEAGATEYVAKPVDVDALLTTVARVLPRRAPEPLQAAAE